MHVQQTKSIKLKSEWKQKKQVHLYMYRAGGVLPRKRLLGMCCWMGQHFHNWTIWGYILVESLELGHTFSGFLG